MANYDYQIRCILGWLHYVGGMPLDEVSVCGFMPPPSR